MSGLKRVKNIIDDGINAICAMIPYQGIQRPVFIIGCGRSGTTILGTALSKNGRITYLNEPRRLWFTAYPEADIWTSEAANRNGKLVLTAADADPAKTKKISRLFRFETLKSRKPVLIEKLPINNFRLNFINKIFPDARFIHIYRNGLEVARSIEKMSETTDWFGEKSYKWARLIEYAQSKHTTENLPTLCSTNFDRGLLEWRLSTEAAVAFLDSMSSETFFEFHYDTFMEHPVDTISQVQDFIGVERDHNVEKFVSENIVRRTGKLGIQHISEKEQLLGGDLLPLSIDGRSGLAGHSHCVLGNT